jgi:hypothetical protein
VPDHPTWLERIPAVLKKLQKPDAPPFLDRAAVEALFGVRRRQAILLLHRWQGYQLGRALVASRESILSDLEQLRYREALEEQNERQERVAAALGEARQALTLPRIAVPAPQKLSDITFAGLPPGIRLERGRLTVEFASAQDLVEKLFTLAQAFANDYESLSTALGEGVFPATE